jgi:hypothetical protein
MAFSALYYGMDKEEENKVEYKGLTFVQTDSGWMAYANDEDKIILANNPLELNESFEKVSYSFKMLGKVYLSISPYDNVRGAVQELERNGFLSQQQRVVMACYEDSEACKEMPLKTCEDAAESVGVMVLKEANETSVTLEGNCLTVEGKNLLNIVDKFIVDQYGE